MYVSSSGVKKPIVGYMNYKLEVREYR